MDINALGAGLSIGLSALGVAIGQGFLVYKSFDVLGKNPKLTPFFLTITVLGIALVESTAIYGLVVALQVLGASFIDPLAAIGVGTAIGLTGLGVGIGEGLLISSAVEAMNTAPGYKNKIMAYMILFVALIESSAIYGLIIALQILYDTDISALASFGAALSIGLAGMGVGIGEGLLAKRSVECMGTSPKEAKKFLSTTILGIALIESAAIYGLVIANQILSSEVSFAALGAALAVGLAGLGVSVGEALLLRQSITEIKRDPKDTKIIISLSVLGVALVESSAIYGMVVAFQTLSASVDSLSLIGAGLSIGLAGLGVGLGQGYLGSGSVYSAGIDRSDSVKITTTMVLFMALVESAAIYALIMSMQIISSDQLLWQEALGISIVIGLASCGVGLGESILARKSLVLMGRRPKFSSYFITVTVLGVALVESAAIYALVVSFDILSHAGALGVAAIGSGLSLGLAALGVGIGEGILVSGAFSAMSRNPQNKVKDLTLMILFVALVEVLAIYGLFVALQIIS